MKSKLFLLLAVVFSLGMMGCATTHQTAPASVAAPPDPRETYAAAMAGCAGAIKDIVIGTGDAVAKVVAVGSIERLCGNGGAQLAAAMQPQPVQQPASVGALIWQAALQVGDIALRGYGIKTQRDVSLAQTYASAATTQSSYAAFAGLGNAIGNTASGIATSGFNALAVAATRPMLPTTSITVAGGGNTNIGSGTIALDTSNRSVATTTTTTTTNTNTNSGNTTRICSGGTAGNGAPGGGGTGTTGPSTGGGGGTGGGALGGNC